MEGIVRELQDLATQKGIRDRAVHARIYASGKHRYSPESERPLVRSVRPRSGAGGNNHFHCAIIWVLPTHDNFF